jgi:hypothetical protein
MRRFVPVLIVLAAYAAPAQAATPPTVSTSPATGITPVGATLNGFATPNGAATNVYFQYGPTKNYGNRTPNQAAGEGTSPVPFSASIAGLKSSKTFHFRAVAVNSAGTKFGADRTFKTAPPATAPVITPNPAVFSRPLSVSGQLIGSGAGGAKVTLLGRGFPFTSPFAKVGNTLVSNADGTYSFLVPGPLGTFQFQIKASTNPPITTGIATVTVTSLVTLRVRTHVRRGSVVKFGGIARPIQDGLLVRIQKRRANGTYKNVAHTLLKHGTDASSRYSKRLRLHRGGTFRAMVMSAGGFVSPGASAAKSIRVTRR